ncbi:MAG: ABC transporter ATP-binding protein, partial [Treponema sp.]
FPHLANILSRSMNIKTVYPILEKFEQIETIEENENAQLPKFNKGIEISNLNFAYDSEKPILKSVNMKFESGKKYGIIGESGCGKTTLFKLLVGMLENYDGKIEYDGVELSKLNKTDIRENIAYIDQSVYIFNDSIKKNICLSQNYSQEQIDKAIDSSALRPMIENLDQGIDSIASESGKNFSGGQRQRIAIARALIHGRKILLIDEGTSSLDKENSLEIEKQLIENPELTVIMVSHHFDPEIKAKLDGVYSLT